MQFFKEITNTCLYSAAEHSNLAILNNNNHHLYSIIRLGELSLLVVPSWAYYCYLFFSWLLSVNPFLEGDYQLPIHTSIQLSAE